MFIGGGYGVGLTVTDVELPLVAPPGTAFPALGELLPVYARSPEEKALELQRVQRLKAELAAYELELVPPSPPTGPRRWTGSRGSPARPQHEMRRRRA